MAPYSAPGSGGKPILKINYRRLELALVVDPRVLDHAAEVPIPCCP